MTGAVDGPFREDLQCIVEQLTYDFRTRTGRLVCAPGHCTDMRGAIRLFERIDRGVREIVTGQGRAATVYWKDGRDWHAGRPMPPLLRAAQQVPLDTV